MNLIEKIQGGIAGALIGDAMGAPTEMRTRDQIIRKFGGYVKRFIQPPDDIFAKGRKPGMVTDDFSLAYYLLKEIIVSEGGIDSSMARNALINWVNDEEYSIRFAGPTTLAAITKLKQGEVFDPSAEFGIVNYNNLGTNGAAMKIFPVGLLNRDDFDKTIDDVITICLPTHFTNLAISGAAAIACAVGASMNKDATKDTITKAGIYGATKGNEQAIKRIGKICAGASIERRIELAVEIAGNAKGFDEVLININDYIGTGVGVTESVPAVFGIISAFNDPMEGIYAGVNIGNDTDTIASMVGAILGTWKGINDIDKDCVAIGQEVNNIDLSDMAKKLFEIIC